MEKVKPRIKPKRRKSVSNEIVDEDEMDFDLPVTKSKAPTSDHSSPSRATRASRPRAVKSSIQSLREDDDAMTD